MNKLRYSIIKSVLVLFTLCSLSCGCNRVDLSLCSQLNLASAKEAKIKWTGSEGLVVISSNIQIYIDGQQLGDNIHEVLLSRTWTSNPDKRIAVLCERDVLAPKFLHVMQDLCDMSIDPCIQIVIQRTAGQYYYFPYQLPLLDGGLSAPWYRIVITKSGTQDNEMRQSIIYTNSHLSGYAEISIHLLRQDYMIAGEIYNSFDIQELLKKAKQEYRVVAVVIIPENTVIFQRIVDLLDLCAEQGIKGYVFSVQ